MKKVTCVGIMLIVGLVSRGVLAQPKDPCASAKLLGAKAYIDCRNRLSAPPQTVNAPPSINPPVRPPQPPVRPPQPQPVAQPSDSNSALWAVAIIALVLSLLNLVLFLLGWNRVNGVFGAFAARIAKRDQPIGDRSTRPIPD